MGNIYRYVGGGSCSVGDRDFESVGQKAEFSHELALDALNGGAVFVTEEQFETLDFTDEEISSLQQVHWSQAGEDVAVKVKRGWILAAENKALASADLL
jgi:hypothetical protein